MRGRAGEGAGAVAAGRGAEERSLTKGGERVAAAKAGPRPWQEDLPDLQRLTELFGVNSEARFKAMQDFVEAVPPRELPVVLKKLAELQSANPTLCGRELESRLLRRWADQDAGSAAKWAAEARGGNRGELLAVVGTSWAREKFADAAAWARGLEDGEDRQRAVASVAYEAIHSDPKGALKLLGDLPAEGERNNTMVIAVAAWAGASPGEAAAWAKQLPEDGLRQQSVSAVALTWAASDPQAAAGLALECMPAGELQDRTVLSIARRWAMMQPGEATAWVKRFPEGTLRETALESIAADQKRMGGK